MIRERGRPMKKQCGNCYWYVNHPVLVGPGCINPACADDATVKASALRALEGDCGTVSSIAADWTDDPVDLPLDHVCDKWRAAPNHDGDISHWYRVFDEAQAGYAARMGAAMDEIVEVET